MKLFPLIIVAQLLTLLYSKDRRYEILKHNAQMFVNVPTHSTSLGVVL